MKKIKNIIDSELILRTNNVRIKQESGAVGNSSAISIEGNTTKFATLYVIDKINFVTINGVTLIEGKHYFITDGNIVNISNSGAPVKKNPTLSTNILVSYYASVEKVTTVNIAPVVSFFTLNSNSGRDKELIFNFKINQNNGNNIFWSIIKDGSSTPLYSGTSLETVNGFINVDTAPVKLNYFVTEQEVLNRVGDNIPFTLIVIYDMSEDGSRLNEKILSTQIYTVQQPEIITGNLNTTPATITSPVSNPIGTNYTINTDYTINKEVGSSILFDWDLVRISGTGVQTTVVSGNQASPLIGRYTEIINVKSLDVFNIRYLLRVKDFGYTVYRTIANDRLDVSIPANELIGTAGYLDASIMSYIDPIDNIRKKIGSTGTSRDRIEYMNRVPRSIFTKNVTKSFLQTNEFISAAVNTFEGTVAAVYFVIEVPDNWGPFDFYQTLGLVGFTAFNKIPLGNGFTAYLYNVAPSAVTSPSDYYIKAI